MAIDGLTSFTANQPAVASEVNGNFTTIKNYVESYCIVKNSASGVTTFETVPSGPSVDPSSDNQFTRKAYVDAVRKSRTGVQTVIANPANVTFAAANTETTLATVESAAAIPINTTHTGLTLVATASCELFGGNGTATFLGTVEVSFDNGTTWETARRINAVAVPGADTGYGGIAVQTYATKDSYTTASVVKARFKATQRAAFSTMYTAASIQLALEIRREVPLA
jgi:hypothetical protein